MIYNKFVNCATLEIFNQNLANGNITSEHIVFIVDVKQIWTQGSFYATKDLKPEDREKLDKIITDGGGNMYLSNDGTYKSLISNKDEIYIGDTQPPSSDKDSTLWISENEYEDAESQYHVDMNHIPTASDRDYLIGTEARYIDPVTAEVTFYKLYSINNGSAVWKSLDADFVRNSNKVTTLVNIPITANSVYAEVTAATTLTLSGTIPTGRSISILIKNVGSSTITQPVPSANPFTNMGPSALTIAAGKFVELNIWAYANGKYSVRTGEML